MPEDNAVMRRMGFFPGCSLGAGGREYAESMRALSAASGIELVEVPDWNCCGASAAHAVNRKLALSLPARSLALAAEAGLEEVLAPCAACYNRLRSVSLELESDDALRSEISEIISRDLNAMPRVVNAVEFAAMLLEDGRARRKCDLAGLKVAPYYGCLLVRPPKATGFDDPENPVSMDEVLRELGAEVVDWQYKVECCGAGHSLSRTDIVVELSGKILAAALAAGADAIVTACPMCHSNLDMRQRKIMRRAGSGERIPIYYLSQLAGLAAGVDANRLGIDRHFVEAAEVLRRTDAEAGD